MKRFPLVPLFSSLILLILSGCGGSVEGMVADQYGITDATQIRWDLLDILFPVVGPAQFTNDWHAARDGGARLHEGNDLLSKKLTPVVAVADGTVAWVHAKVGGECCYMAITHESQGLPYESWYIHLNNDTPGTDDGKVIGIAKGIRKGVHVQAGQLIGWVGDSGNAENTTPHLHFELHDEFGNPINPYLILKRARHIDRVLSAP
jgi:murein DD-endopeptidase MepM/ murein hydrolase activator NlpD